MDHRLTSWSPFPPVGKKRRATRKTFYDVFFLSLLLPSRPRPTPLFAYIYTHPRFFRQERRKGEGTVGEGLSNPPPGGGGSRRGRRRRKLCCLRAQKGGKESRNSGGKGNPFISHFRFFSLSPSRSSPSHACQWQLKDPTLHSAAVRRCHTSLPQLIRKDSSVWLDFSQFFSSGFPPRPWERNYFIFFDGGAP